MITSRQREILLKLVVDGNPAKNKLSVCHLSHGRYLCELAEMKELEKMGLVMKVPDQAEALYGVTGAGREESRLKERWEMTPEEYFSDENRVRNDVADNRDGYQIHYTYLSQHPFGPFKGTTTVDYVPLHKGDIYETKFGREFGNTVITSISKTKLSIDEVDLNEILQTAGQIHKREVFDAKVDGKPVRDEVLAAYPDLVNFFAPAMSAENEPEAPAL